MPLGCIRVGAEFETAAMTCLRCGREAPMRFAGACDECTAELRQRVQGVARDLGGATFEPKLNVTPNAVALKDD